MRCKLCNFDVHASYSPIPLHIVICTETPELDAIKHDNDFWIASLCHHICCSIIYNGTSYEYRAFNKIDVYPFGSASGPLPPQGYFESSYLYLDATSIKILFSQSQCWCWWIATP